MHFGALDKHIPLIDVERIRQATDGWGVEVVFEATGSPQAAATVFDDVT